MSKSQLNQDNKRILPRIPCRIVVSNNSRSAPLGSIVDMSLDGAFLNTQQPLPQGSVLPMAIALGDEKEEIVVDVEIVRTTAEGMGVRFIRMSRRDSRRLRRYIAETTSIVGHREFVAKLHDVSSSIIKPINKKEIIFDLLLKSKNKSIAYTIIPGERSSRSVAVVDAWDEQKISLKVSGVSDLTPGESIFVLYTLDFISYSFQSEVVDIQKDKVDIKSPDIVYYSERRSIHRQLVSEGSCLELKVSWRQEPFVWALYDYSESGFSFKVRLGEFNFLPGTPLNNALLRLNGQETVLENSIVKHVTVIEELSDEAQWMFVGAEYGLQRSNVLQGQEKITSKSTPGAISSLAAWGRNLSAKAAYLYHQKIKKNLHKETNPFTLVRFVNQKGQPLVGLLNTSFSQKEKTRAPVVIVIPGYGGRKEVFSALAMILVENFKNQYRDLAVFRIDTTNNLGESYKNPGCEGEGKHTLQYTILANVMDTLAAIAWVKNNRYVDPTDIVIVSSSFSSVAVRRALTMPEGLDVSLWIPLMGAADIQNSVTHVSGNIDLYGNSMRNIPNGVVSLIGCMIDADHFSSELQEQKIATVEDARHDMAKIRADVCWIIGKQDAYMDPGRIRDIMGVKSPGKREIIEVDSGHMPQSSDEAFEQFSMLTSRIWRHLYGSMFKSSIPSRGWLAAISEMEWKRVRQIQRINYNDYWKSYLLGEDGIGFDVFTLSPYYNQFVQKQIDLSKPQGKVVLDLGAGTGNISHGIALEKPSHLVCQDIVTQALERLETKLPTDVSHKLVVHTADGGPMIALRRWVKGELYSLQALAGRLPGLQQKNLDGLISNNNPALNAYLKGAQLDSAETFRSAHLNESQQLLSMDLHHLSRYILGRISQSSVEDSLRVVSKTIFTSHNGLPYKDAYFDSIVCSLVLSYLDYPEDALSEMFRVLKPNGILVLSSMRRDADGSKFYLELIDYLETAPEEQLPKHSDRATLIKATRDFSNKAAELLRFVEEGSFQFWSGEELANLTKQAGFEDTQIYYSFGDPGRAVIVQCRRP